MKIVNIMKDGSEISRMSEEKIPSEIVVSIFESQNGEGEENGEEKKKGS